MRGPRWRPRRCGDFHFFFQKICIFKHNNRLRHCLTKQTESENFTSSVVRLGQQFFFFLLHCQKIADLEYWAQLLFNFTPVNVHQV